MLEHQMKLLENLIKSEELFYKELKKSLKWLTRKEQHQLAQWVKDKAPNSVRFKATALFRTVS